MRIRRQLAPYEESVVMHIQRDIIVLPAMYIKRISLEKATELNERQQTEWKECRKDMRRKQ